MQTGIFSNNFEDLEGPRTWTTSDKNM